MLKRIQAKNPKYTIYPINSKEFKTYGCILKNDLQDAIDLVIANNYSSGYLPSVEALEQLDCIKNLSKQVYGYLEAMAGVVTGNNHVLNGIEYHQCSEVIVAVTDYILVVGHRFDMEGNKYDTSNCEIFYVPQGTVIECYATTLHYTPIAVSNSGFQTICLLLKGTGDSIERSEILKKKNKWFIAHPDNTAKVADGDYPGLLGEMIEIKLD